MTPPGQMGTIRGFKDTTRFYFVWTGLSMDTDLLILSSTFP